MQNKNVIRISRKEISLTFIDELYTCDGVSAITEDDHMSIPLDKIHDWAHDMGIILGRAIKKIVERKADNEDV